eukprot:scaffold1415_cov242-Pinguiococcus_pyrenoidosus.AAC.10
MAIVRMRPMASVSTAGIEWAAKHQSWALIRTPLGRPDRLSYPFTIDLLYPIRWGCVPTTTSPDTPNRKTDPTPK